jgi:hypothetical protein
MKKTFTALVAVATMAGSLVSVMPTAKASDGQIAAGVAGGLIGGALLGGAIAASRPAPVYVAPGPVYVEEPACRWVRERFWDGYGWRFRRVQVCCSEARGMSARLQFDPADASAGFFFFSAPR